MNTRRGLAVIYPTGDTNRNRNATRLQLPDGDDAWKRIDAEDKKQKVTEDRGVYQTSRTLYEVLVNIQTIFEGNLPG